MRALVLVTLALVGTAAAWLDPHATAREAARLYAAGKFDDAAAKYREALVDDPDSALLHFNLGAAAYRQGKFDDAIAALGQIPSSDADPARTARTAYDVGNAKFRQGAAVEASNPQEALGRYAEALVAYRRAMGADPTDEDAKFNHEFVEKRIADLKKKLEEQKKEQEEKQQQNQERQNQQQQNQQQQNQQQQNQQQQDQHQQDQQQNQGQQNPQQRPNDQEQAQDQQKQDTRAQDQQQKDQQQQASQEQAEQQRNAEQRAKDSESAPSDAGERTGERGGAGPVAGGEPSDEMSRRDAEALLDAQRDQEVRPDEIVRKLQGADVAEPREDW